MLKLVYFKMRALAEAPQLLLEYSGLEYEYLMSWDHFDDVWSKVKPMIPFQQLPMMEVGDGTQICQSIAILQYLENRSGLSCLLYTSPSPRDGLLSRMPSSA